MSFACIYVPDFLVQAAVRVEPALCDQALVLLTGTPPLWSVVAASPAARHAGIQLGMTKAQVAEFSGIEVRERCEAHEKAAHAALLDVGWSVSPRVEDTAADTIVLDLEGLKSLFGAEEGIAQELARRATHLGMMAHVGVASNIDTAIVAARGYAGVTVIPAGEECARLGELLVDVLVTNAEVLETLGRWGVRTLRELAALPVLQLSERLGQEGVRLHALACGAWVRALVRAEPKLRFEEEMELDDSIEELEPLSFLLGRLLDQLCARLEARALAVRAVHLWFALEPSFEAEVQNKKDASRKKTAVKEYENVLTLPVAMRDSKILLKLLRLLLQSDPPLAPIQKIRLVGEATLRRVTQSGLFVPKGPDPEKLELTVARLAKLVGKENIGAAELLDTHRFENFRMSKFDSAMDRVRVRTKRRREMSSGAESVANPGLECGSSLRQGTTAGFRVIRPAVPVHVELREARPVLVFFRGAKGEVTAASGPWRSSGDWWQEEAWDQDEWDLAIDFGVARGQRERRGESWPERGVYRVVYDGLRRSWIVRGFYD
jgi:protein ImuB